MILNKMYEQSEFTSDIQKERKEKSTPCKVCGGKYLTSNKSKHFKTKKHQKAVLGSSSSS